jgi:hypothetical protein
MSPSPEKSPEITQDYSDLLTGSGASPSSPSESTITPPLNLTDRQLAALELMVLGQTDTAIAKSLKIERKTLYNWRTHNLAFREELLRRRESLLGQSTDRYRALLNSAMDLLERQLQDQYNPTSHRAASTLLRFSRIGHYLAPQIPKPKL